MNMRKLILPLILIALLVPTFSFGQTAILLQTTLSSSVTNITQNQFKLASVTGATAGMMYYVGGEAGIITAVDTTNTLITVRRGTNGTNTQPHNTSDEVFVDLPKNFYSADPINGGFQAAYCIASPTASAPNPNGTPGYVTKPWINIRNGNIWDCDTNTNMWKVSNALHGPGGGSVHTQGDANYTATYADYIIDYTTATAGRTLTFPDVKNINGKIYILRNDSGQTITVQGSNSQNIEGSSTTTVTTGNFKGWVSAAGLWVRIQ